MSRIRTACQFIAWAIPRWLAPRQEDELERAKQQLMAANEKLTIAAINYDRCHDEYERLSGTTVLPRKVS